MAHTTLASTDRALEKIGEFVAVQDYPSLKAVGRTFAQKAAVLVGLRRSIPKRYAKKAKRRLPAVNSHAKALVASGQRPRRGLWLLETCRPRAVCVWAAEGVTAVRAATRRSDVSAKTAA